MSSTCVLTACRKRASLGMNLLRCKKTIFANFCSREQSQAAWLRSDRVNKKGVVPVEVAPLPFSSLQLHRDEYEAQLKYKPVSSKSQPVKI
ncbi:putative transaldolase [Frankliniella fusca]|uniref:Transaldolase n=1 Tax=Frankliniella fusca TaxID=407009 RepID=A0AAE1I2K7_9NEOP|nr:putative transaldolase [Frankliniella fusca]